MAGVPAENRLGLGERRQMLGGDHALHCDGAKIDEFEIVACFQRLERRQVEAGTEARRLDPKARETRSRAQVPQALRLGGQKQRIKAVVPVLQHDRIADNDVKAGATVSANADSAASSLR